MGYCKRVHANLNHDTLIFPQKYDAYRLTLAMPLLAPLRKLVHKAGVQQPWNCPVPRLFVREQNLAYGLAHMRFP